MLTNAKVAVIFPSKELGDALTRLLCERTDCLGVIQYSALTPETVVDLRKDPPDVLLLQYDPSHGSGIDRQELMDIAPVCEIIEISDAGIGDSLEQISFRVLAEFEAEHRKNFKDPRPRRRTCWNFVSSKSTFKELLDSVEYTVERIWYMDRSIDAVIKAHHR